MAGENTIEGQTSKFQSQERACFIKSLSALIDSAHSRSNDLLNELGWTKEGVLDENGGDKDLVQCPFDNHHLVHSTKLDSHVKGCFLKSAGLDDLSAKDLPESTSFFYQSPSSSVTQVFLDKSQLESIGLAMKSRPKTETHRDKNSSQSGEGGLSKEINMQPGEDAAHTLFQLPANYLETMLSVEDRLKLYEYVLQRSKLVEKKKTLTYDELEQDTVEQLRVLEMQNQDDTDRPKSKVEAMAELRDYKRRRQSYRAKTLTQSKRPATEVIRELIDQQMKYLEIISGKRPIADEEEENESEQNTELLNDAVDGSARDQAYGSASKYSKDTDGEIRSRSTHRYGIMESSETRRGNRSREEERDLDERRYRRDKDGRERYTRSERESRDKHRGRAFDKDTIRDRDRDGTFEKDTRRERDRDGTLEKDTRRERNRDGTFEKDGRRDRDRKTEYRERGWWKDEGREIYRKEGSRRGYERESTRKDSDMHHSSIEDRGSGEGDVSKVTRVSSKEAGMNMESRDSFSNISAGNANENSWLRTDDTKAEVMQSLKEIRREVSGDARSSRREYSAHEVDDVNELQENGAPLKRRRGREGSQSGSLTGSRSGSEERYKEKRHKKKKKRRKSDRKRSVVFEDGSDGEWIEKV